MAVWPPLIERLANRTTFIDGGCWLWTGYTDKAGYGHVMAFGRSMSVSQASWQFFHDQDPRPDDVLHCCDTPACWNPDHLFKGDHQANMTDRNLKGRQYSKLRREDIPVIRTLRANGVPIKDVAEMYGVGQPTISEIVHRKAWAHVP